ncbi:L-threonine synthase [Chthonomonas calidirosea]|uniref:Threonine synthase n=1 Tax=Chthonomonas calidirosea (strain DSM 23976 / ICMP 18418 / T49) TaxID=1303518 RepID=S0EZ45_CHTCT|nr:threonine synthase [Chthonomonas calidirosea]CCW35459.1 L-threonine synthase [Chthonomonas calidirosea T49]CEK19227.1 L-threonine synthase [Chthonomonas calidirosea]CEK19228.1 L-threonine synthase [Chthonomonas calidirosea]CEK20214.1 L-threonine synthase [Chthonomonas calidirosea]
MSAKTLGMQCRECGKEYPLAPVHVCELCFGPLEVKLNWELIEKRVTRESIAAGPPSMWRYWDLLPVEGPPTVGKNVGWTPLVKAERLGRELGLNNLYVKNDAVNHPTLSFKDRVVAVALTKAREFGYDTVACASTGNLANSVAAHAAEGGFRSYIFIPADLEQGKVVGTLIYGTNVLAVSGCYDEVNRLCAEAGDRYGWGFVNINLRPFYGDGSKTYGYEIAEQLGWRAPDHVIVPCAGGSLISKIYKGLKELERLGLLDGPVNTRMYAAQATGCSPITTAIKTEAAVFRPQRPNTIARSIAIGNPADGYTAIETVRKSGGWAEDVTDEEVVEGIRLLARTEGIFTETAGGVTVSVTKKLAEQGRFGKDDVVVIAITGNGLKTQEAVMGRVGHTIPIEPNLNSLEAALKTEKLLATSS